MATSPRLSPGTPVSLPDGTFALAYEDRCVGGWTGRYRVSITHRDAIVYGFTRADLTEVPTCRYDARAIASSIARQAVRS